MPESSARATLIGNLLGRRVAPAIAARVAEVAEGNPAFFIEETVRMLLDEGPDRPPTESGWKPARDLADARSCRPLIEALLAARLDRLEPA